MSNDPAEPAGPDFTKGVPLSDLPDGGMLGGHAHGKPVLLARLGDEVFAVGGTCTHYSGPLAEGLVVGDTVRCPWHHACFRLRTGEAVRAPALNPIARWATERRGGSVFVTKELDAAARRGAGVAVSRKEPDSVVIVGAGAAGDAAADMLRREGYEGPITLIGSDKDAPYDRPNLSKDYLAGTAAEEWIPLRPGDYYEARKIRLVLGTRVTAIDRSNARVVLDDGTETGFGALLLATGASPVRLPTPAEGQDVHYLRTLEDSRAIIKAAEGSRRAVVIGASFIGLEVAASLRTRGLDVHVVAPESYPLERIMGRALSDFVRGLHESRGVVFHLGRTARAIGADVILDDGTRLPADVVVVGVGVRPNDELATHAGLAVDRGIVVDPFLETSTPGIFAAGDVARYPDPRTGDRIRVEHWVHAQRQGQTAARNMLGKAKERFDTVPFFWSQHYDVQISYAGHAEKWDRIEIDGSVEGRDCVVSFIAGKKTLAVATVGRDLASLQAEAAMERETPVAA